MKSRLTSMYMLAAMLVSPPGFSADPNTTSANGTGPPANISPPVAEVIRIAHSGVDDNVVLAFIENSSSAFSLTSDQIIYLHNAGLSSTDIVAMVRHDRLMRERSAASASDSSPPTPPSPDTQPPPSSQPAQTPDDAAASANGNDTSSQQADNYFNSYLAPYGSWSNLPGYGWGWQPTVAANSPGWTPYCDGGQWFYTNRGWYWNSYYPWGWAPFHYGCWSHNPQCGWVWFPGKTWAPSWVTWRTSKDCIGWAPLPPGNSIGASSSGSPANFANAPSAHDFTFVQTANFGAMNLRSCCLNSSQAGNAFAGSSALNNFSPAPDGSMSNWGPDYNRITSSGQIPIVRADLQNSPSLAGAGIIASRSPNTPATVQIFRPELQFGRPPLQSTQPLLSGAPSIQFTQPLQSGRPPLLNNPQPSSAEAQTLNPSVPAASPPTVTQNQPIPPTVPGQPEIGTEPSQTPNGTFRFHSAFHSPPTGSSGFTQPSQPSAPFAPTGTSHGGGRHK